MAVRKPSAKRGSKQSALKGLREDYWLLRDFEYVQLLHDLSFFLEVDSLAKGTPVPEYRAFSLFRAAYSLDSYGTTISRWLNGDGNHKILDYVPSKRIREYLLSVRETGTLPELASFRGDEYERARRLRSVRGVGNSAIASTLLLSESDKDLAHNEFFQNLSETAQSLFRGPTNRMWQNPHVTPPLMRFLNAIEKAAGRDLRWVLKDFTDPFTPVVSPFVVAVTLGQEELNKCIILALETEVLFRYVPVTAHDKTIGRISHQMGWELYIMENPVHGSGGLALLQTIEKLDPLAHDSDSIALQGDLHLHTTWSDGSALPEAMAEAAAKLGLKYIFVTDHSRSSKLQNGLTPAMWIRQAGALASTASVIPILQGLEVDILTDGSLDLPPALLRGTRLVIGSVHTGWTENLEVNTERVLTAIESGLIDILGHPSSMLLGKMGVPDFVRSPAPLDWKVIFAACSKRMVALEFNCFPSRFDLGLPLLKEAMKVGCMISFGSDAHARAHLMHLRYGAFALSRLDPQQILNTFSLSDLIEWLAKARSRRTSLETQREGRKTQASLPFAPLLEHRKDRLSCCISGPQILPKGSVIVGIDLTAGEKLTGICVLRDNIVETRSVKSDEEIYDFIRANEPAIVSIDSPLGLPGGGPEVDPSAGIVREAERDLSSIGIPAYPALIDSMRNLTLRGIGLRKYLESLPEGPRVIESYPGAAQDILRISRKQKGLEQLRSGLQRLGIEGPGLDTESHDEMDSITSAVVGRYFEQGEFEAMGIPSEAQLIVPKVAPLAFATQPIICLSGKTGSGKSVVARYLSVFYGFEWIRTRDLIRSLLMADQKLGTEQRLSQKIYDISTVSEQDLQEFGAVILHEHGQVSLRQALSAAISATSRPVVVDSIRDVSDLAPLQADFLRIWFVNSDEAQILKRLATRTKLGFKRLASRPLVDSKSAKMKKVADDILDNNSSLEALRWKVDDTLFNALHFVESDVGGASRARPELSLEVN